MRAVCQGAAGHRALTCKLQHTVPHRSSVVAGTRGAALPGLPHRRLLGLADLLVVRRLERLAVAKDAQVAHLVGLLAEAAQSLLNPASTEQRRVAASERLAVLDGARAPRRCGGGVYPPGSIRRAHGSPCSSSISIRGTWPLRCMISMVGQLERASGATERASGAVGTTSADEQARRPRSASRRASMSSSSVSHAGERRADLGQLCDGGGPVEVVYLP